MKPKLSAGILLLLLVPQVLGDGIIIPPHPKPKPLDQNSQIAVINYQDGLERLIISVNFEMNISEAVWIFPVPAKPDKTVINIVTEFPRLTGYEVTNKAKLEIDEMIRTSRFTQIYPFFIPRYMVLYRVGRALAGLGGVREVTVHEHIEKEGITTELITTETGQALYDYLESKGLELEPNALPVLDDYVGKEYTFVVSWVSSMEERIYCEEPRPEICIQVYEPVCGSNGRTYSNWCMACRDPSVEWYTKGTCEFRRYYRRPAVFITFPTDRIYYPLLPTSVYGSKRIPIEIYVMDYVKPEMYEGIKPYTKTNYYIGYGLEFYGGYKEKYTKIEINAPSKYLIDDLWFSEGAPAKVNYASMIVSIDHWITKILMILLLSALTGGLAGFIIFKEAKKYALLGLANVFSIVGLGIAVAFTKTKELSESLRKQIEKEGLVVITKDIKKLYFVILFSVLFLVIGWVVGYLLKLPLA